MTDQRTEGLSDEDVESLRDLPRDLPVYAEAGGLRSVKSHYTVLARAGLVTHRPAQQSTEARMVSPKWRYERTAVADLLLATLDDAVAAEREQVLTEINDAMADVYSVKYLSSDAPDMSGDYDEWWEVRDVGGGMRRGAWSEPFTEVLFGKPQDDEDSA